MWKDNGIKLRRPCLLRFCPLCYCYPNIPEKNKHCPVNTTQTGRHHKIPDDVSLCWMKNVIVQNQLENDYVTIDTVTDVQCSALYYVAGTFCYSIVTCKDNIWAILKVLQSSA